MEHVACIPREGCTDVVFHGHVLRRRPQQEILFFLARKIRLRVSKES
jgi:hypothetical protein